MKKYKILLLVLVGIMGSLFYGCEKDTESQDKSEEANIILFEDLTLLQNVSPNYYDNHIYRVELLGNNDELCNLVARVSENGIQADQLNIYGSRKHLFNHTSAIMYSIPFNNSKKKVIVYQYEDIAEVMLASYEDEGVLDRFSIKTTDESMFYSLQVNEEGAIGNIVTEFNPRMELFNEEAVEIQQQKLDLERDRISTKATCCRKADGILSCMECTSAAFRTTFIGNLTLSLFGIEAYSAIGISCINANPDAVC